MQDIESSAPDALILINGDFNHHKLLNSGVTYYQHVDCPTRGSVTLDYCYSNVKQAYTVSPLPGLGKADHNLVLLRPMYTPIVQRERPKVI